MHQVLETNWTSNQQSQKLHCATAFLTRYHISVMLIGGHSLPRRNVATINVPLVSNLLSHQSSKPLRQFIFFLPRSSLRFASSKRWVDRQSKDRFARQARVQGLKSRAAFKLLQINEKYRLFKPGQTVVDLGYAPGSWSQVLKNTYITNPFPTAKRRPLSDRCGAP